MIKIADIKSTSHGDIPIFLVQENGNPTLKFGSSQEYLSLEKFIQLHQKDLLNWASPEIKNKILKHFNITDSSSYFEPLVEEKAGEFPKNIPALSNDYSDNVAKAVEVSQPIGDYYNAIVNNLAAQNKKK